MRTRIITMLTATLAILGLTTCASPNWPAYRYTGLRQGNQPDATALSNPHKVPGLAVRWTFNSPNGDSFYASPIVVGKRVFIGGTSGYFYALNAGHRRFGMAISGAWTPVDWHLRRRRASANVWPVRSHVECDL